MTIDEMRARKRELGYSYQMIADLAGLPVGTVQKVLGGITKAPRRDTVAALESVLGGGSLYGEAKDSAAKRDSVLVREPVSSYGAGRPGGGQKKQGEYTLADYYALPDERRAELIDGVIYDMASPSAVHQILLGELHFQIASYIKGKHGSCVPAVAPLDVQLDRDERTVVQPDMIILCDRSRLHRQVIYGAPDFVAEILSSSTRRRDMRIKLGKYAQAGVREYWMIDPDRKKIAVYDFEHDELPAVYGFRDSVPMAIYGGDCRIDFAAMDDYIRELEGQEE